VLHRHADDAASNKSTAAGSGSIATTRMNTAAPTQIVLELIAQRVIKAARRDDWSLDDRDALLFVLQQGWPACDVAGTSSAARRHGSTNCADGRLREPRSSMPSTSSSTMARIFAISHSWTETRRGRAADLAIRIGLGQWRFRRWSPTTMAAAPPAVRCDHHPITSGDKASVNRLIIRRIAPKNAVILASPTTQYEQEIRLTG
jgi:hypothetical protein